MITPSFSLTATERVLPKLALDFTTASLDARVTFTRTTSASNPATFIASNGYITAATNNQPRFDYNPLTLACNGLLIEESRVNICRQSDDFATTWSTDGTTNVSTNAVVSPDNTQNADKLVEAATTGQHYIRQANTVSNATAHTVSVYAKKGERESIAIRLIGASTYAQAYFNLSAGTVTPSTGTASIVAMPNGWYRCVVTGTSNSTTTNIYINIGQTATSTSISSYTGDGVSGLFLWGAQLEAGAFPTSYIPTTTAALTRNADVATMTGTNFSDWYNASEGAAIVQVLPSTISGTRPAIEFNDNTANQAITLRGAAADPQLFVVNGGAAQATLDAGTITANAAYKLGGAWKSSSFAASINGGGSVSQLSGTYPTVTQARLGSDGTNYLNGCLQNLRYWPQRITNAETQAFSK